MADDFVGISLEGLDEIRARLDKLPPLAQDLGVETANAYIIRKEQTYASYKYVSVRESGGWKSERQRRYVMAMIRSGAIRIPYRRTQTLRRGWKALGTGRNQIVVNEVKYAPYVKDIKSQSLGHMLRGWDVTQTDLQNWMDGVVRQFDVGVKKAMKDLRLG